MAVPVFARFRPFSRFPSLKLRRGKQRFFNHVALPPRGGIFYHEGTKARRKRRTTNFHELHEARRGANRSVGCSQPKAFSLRAPQKTPGSSTSAMPCGFVRRDTLCVVWELTCWLLLHGCPCGGTRRQKAKSQCKIQKLFGFDAGEFLATP